MNKVTRSRSRKASPKAATLDSDLNSRTNQRETLGGSSDPIELPTREALAERAVTDDARPGDEGAGQGLALDQRLLSETRQLLAAFKAIEPLSVREAMMTIMIECINHLVADGGSKEASGKRMASLNSARQ